MLRVIQMPDRTDKLSLSLSVLEELCKSQQVLIEVQDERLSNIEHDLALVLSVLKDRKNAA
jgi:hypothetical protein